MKTAAMYILVVGISLTTAGGIWGALGWILFVAAVVMIVVQQTVIKKLREELDYARNEMELMSNQTARLKADLEALDQRFLKAHTKMLEMSKNMERMVREEKERDTEVAMLKKTVETNAKTIERLSEALDKRELEQ